MRQIGHLTDEKSARTFADYLVANGIRNQFDGEPDGTWSVWILEEDQVATAQTALARFRAQPEAGEFTGASAGAEKARVAAAADLAAYQRRIRTRRSVFPKFGGNGIGILTYALIFICLIVAYYSSVGRNLESLSRLFISDPLNGSSDFLPEVASGEVWRVFTPIFIHFGLLHIGFNMLWLFQLGCMIEGRHSALYLLALVAVTALLSNVAQYQFGHRYPIFGGMSGVVYGLAGYCWIRGKYDPGSGVGLDRQSVTMLLVWLVICYTGAVGPIANTAHLVGLLTGMAWGRIAAFIAMRNPK